MRGRLQTPVLYEGMPGGGEPLPENLLPFLNAGQDWKNHKPLCKPGLQAANTEPSRSTPSATDPSIRIHRHDVALGGGQGIVVTPRSPTTKSGGGQYTVNIGGVKLHSENEALSVQQLKDLAATIKSGSI